MLLSSLLSLDHEPRSTVHDPQLALSVFLFFFFFSSPFLLFFFGAVGARSYYSPLFSLSICLSLFLEFPLPSLDLRGITRRLSPLFLSLSLSLFLFFLLLLLLLFDGCPETGKWRAKAFERFDFFFKPKNNGDRDSLRRRSPRRLSPFLYDEGVQVSLFISSRSVLVC